MSLFIDGMKLPKDTAEIRITWSNNGNWYARYKGTDEWHKVTESKDAQKELTYCPNCGKKLAEE